MPKIAMIGAGSVGKAVVASTLTTIAVFLPVVFVQEEAGQLFRDIAIAISSAVFLSLLVSITGIPTLSAKILGRVAKSKAKTARLLSLNGLAGGFVNGITRFIYWMCGYATIRIAMVIVLTFLSVSFVFGLMPKTEYLPEGNREMLFGILIPPPGYNLEEMKRIAVEVEKDILPLVNHGGENIAAEKLNLPPIDSFFFVAFGNQAFMGIMSKIQERTKELLPYVYGSLRKIPGMIAIVQQPGLFQGQVLDLGDLHAPQRVGRDAAILLDQHVATLADGDLLGDGRARQEPLDLRVPHLENDPLFVLGVLADALDLLVLDGELARVLLDTLAGEDLDADHDTLDPRWAAQRGVAYVARLLPEDRPQELLLGRQLGFSLGGNLAHKEVARRHLRPQTDDTAHVQVLERRLQFDDQSVTLAMVQAARLDQRLGARRCLAMVGARLERHIGGGVVGESVSHIFGQ